MSVRGPALTERGAALLEQGPGPVRVGLSVNGARRTLDIEPRVSLLDALREHLHLTGAKKGCDQEPAGRAPCGSTGGARWPASPSP